MNEDIIEFDLKRFEEGKVAVHCTTEEQCQNFVDWVCSFHVEIEVMNLWFLYQEDCCCTLTNCYTWEVEDLNFFKERGYEIITYGEALLKKT